MVLNVIEELLRDLLHGADLPDTLLTRLLEFDPDAFDVHATCAKLHLATAEDRRSLLSLISEVVDADDIHDMAEDQYIRGVAEAIGAAPEEYADLTGEVLQIASVRATPTPPPVPPEASEG